MKNIQENKSQAEAPNGLQLQVGEHLRSYVPAELPLDNPRSQTLSDDYDVYKFTLTKEACDVLNLFTRNLSIDPGVVLLAAIHILHFRYSRINQCAIGLRVGRHSSPVGETSTQPYEVTLLCLSMGHNETFSMVAEGILQAIRSSSQFSENAWLDAIGELKWSKSDQKHQFIPIVVTLDGFQPSYDMISMSSARVNFDTEWRFHCGKDSVECDLKYHRFLFGTETICAFADNFMDVVNGLLLESTLSVEAIPWSRALEQVKHAQIPIDLPPQVPRSSLAEAFETMVAENQDKIALVEGELSLTYRELNIVSAAFARKISEMTQESEKYGLISLCIPPSATAVITILGIIKYGAAYVPLDVRFPKGRLVMLLNDSGARLIITTSESPDIGTDLPHVARLDVSEFLNGWRSHVASPDASALPSNCGQSDLAYIMYTSGSTGKPKGVAIKQSSVVALASNRDTLYFNPDDRVAQINNLAWDASVIDVWCTFLTGATLFCFTQYDVLDPEALASQFKRYEISCCLMAPALFRQVIVNAPEVFQTLRRLRLGGDAIYYESIRKLRDINPSLTVQNLYGPTETCVAATMFTISPEDNMPESGPVPIGHPLKNCQVLVVDNNGQLVPPGVVGELLIGGEGVARGYLNRPAETSHAFVEMEFEGLNQPRSTLYRTGDAVKWRADGQLQFVDRLNIGQVKIRGQRLELAEVEAAIIGTGLVRNAAVTFHKPADGRDPFLVAYVVNCDSESQVDINLSVKDQMNTESGSLNLVETWRELYDDMYSSYDVAEARSKFFGWDSMVTGLPIAHDEMTAWLHDTLRPFSQRCPRTVFEVGCGIGIFLYEMAPFVEHVWAIEPSKEAVTKLNAQLQADNMAEKFSIWHGPADCIPKLPPFQSEFVLINSVVQYLPSEAYLRDMVVHVVDKCVPGGQILLGDIRSFSFDDLLGIDIVWHEWKEELDAHTIQDLRGRIITRNQNRTELLVDPTFFLDLQRSIPAISHVEILPKILEKSNELSQFRYQVLLHIGQDVTTVVPDTWYDYQALKWNSDSLEAALRTFVAGEGTILAVERIPNKFLSWEEALASIVFSPSSDALASLASLPPQESWTFSGWSAWDLKRLADRFSVEIHLSFARQSQSTTLDVVFLKSSIADPQYILFKEVEKTGVAIPSFSIHSLQHLGPKYNTRPEHHVLERLKTVLPMYMIPEAVYSLSSLPLLSNGKLDRRKVSVLADADAGRGFYIKDPGTLEIPEDVLERQVCEIFATTLSCGAISPSSDFFSIGGNSLLAARLKAAIRVAFGVRISLRDLFSKPKPSDVASIIRRIGPSIGTPADSTDLRITTSLDTLSEGTYYPLSFAQGRLWFLAQVNGPEDVSYNSGAAWELSGDLNTEALKRTIQEIGSRHEILRTIFVEVDGNPMSRVLDALPCLNILDIPSTTNSTELQGLVSKSMLQPFGLDSEPPFRATLLCVSPYRSILLLAIHHIIWDGYSIGVLQDELVELYSAFSQGKDHNLPSLSTQYKEFAHWQHTDAFNTLLQPQIRYWKMQLHGSRPAEFPTDYPRPSHFTGRAGSHGLPCKPDTLQRLQSVCRIKGVTLFMWLLTVFRAVHYQLTGQEDASLAYPIANRNRFETGNMLGFFVNTQVFRLKVFPEVKFSELLDQTQDLLLAAYENEDLPFDRLVSILNPDRDLSRNPLVQIVCTYDTARISAFSCNGIDISPFQMPIAHTRFDLEFFFRPRDEQLFLEICYNTDLFKPTTIVQLAQRVQTLLEQVIQNPDLSILPDQLPSHAIRPIIRDLINYLDDYTPAELPLDYSRAPQLPRVYQLYQFELTEDICATLDLLLTLRGVEESRLILLAALRILHFRYTLIEDAATGLCVDNETSSYRAVVVRLPVSGNDTFSQVLEETRSAVSRVSKFSDILFSEIVTELQSYGTAACDSIIHVMLSLAIGGKRDNLVLQRDSMQFDMEWQIYSTEDVYKCDLVYNGALFRKETIQAFSYNFIDIVESLLQKPSLTIDNITFTHTLEQLKENQIPIEPSPQASQGTLVGAFNAAVIEHNENVALVDGELSLTYGELDVLSSALAKRISETTQGQEKYELIPFCIPPSALAILTIVGIIKYGAAYVPLDVRFPHERLATLLNDSGARLLITTSTSPELGTDSSRVTRLDISELLVNWKSSTTTLDIATLPSYPSHTDLAYIMYTSGSTGRPKGVAIKQSSLLAFVSNRDVFPFGPDYLVAQLTNLAWDLSVIDVWCTLLSGATLVCFNRYDVLDSTALAIQFKECHIDCCVMSPALFREAFDIAPDLFRTLKALILGGESIYYESLQRLKEINPSLKIQNVYGPTEACVATTTFTIYPGDEMPESGPVPIGQPLKTSQVLVIDRNGRLVPPGIVGELLIGGQGVACGYLNRPDETSHAFIETEFEGLERSRAIFYRSGDAVKWRSDGQLEFIGRMDPGQIKIRGQRLELAEVEAMIIRTGLVQRAAVVYHKPANGHDPFLVAYIVHSSKDIQSRDNRPPFNSTNSSQEASPLHRRLLDYLQRSSPSFMIPQVIRSISGLPLLPTGKLDRRQLDAQTAATAESLSKIGANGSLEAPHDKIERKICEIFEEVLECAPIYRSSDFFAHGGHSILAQRIVPHIRQAFDVPLKVEDIFELRTPKALAEKIASTLASALGNIY